MRFMLFVALALLWTLGPGLAQTPPTRVRGTITALDGATLTVTSVLPHPQMFPRRRVLPHQDVPVAS